MKFTAAILALATSVVALPNMGPSGQGETHGKEIAKPGAQQPFWPLQQDVTVEEAKTACGNQAQVACCNDVAYTSGDTTDISSGPLAGALSDLLGGKNGAKGLALFDKCSKLNVDRKCYHLVMDLDQLLMTLQSSLVSATLSTSSASRTLPAARTTAPLR